MAIIGEILSFSLAKSTWPSEENVISLLPSGKASTPRIFFSHCQIIRSRINTTPRSSSLAKSAWPSKENVFPMFPKKSTIPLSEEFLMHHANLISGYWRFIAPFCIMSWMNSCNNILKQHCFSSCNIGCDIIHLYCTECYRKFLS
jgi:hypothetical protein